VRRLLAPACVAVLFAAVSSVAQTGIEFEPKVGAASTRVTIRTTVPAGGQVLFGGKPVSVIEEAKGIYSFQVPATASGTAFVEIAKDGKPVAKSAVPFVVSGPSVVSVPKLVGLKEAIDVFGYADTRPEGGGKPEPKARPILKFDDDEVLTIGDPPPFVLGPLSAPRQPRSPQSRRQHPCAQRCRQCLPRQPARQSARQSAHRPPKRVPRSPATTGSCSSNA